MPPRRSPASSGCAPHSSTIDDAAIASGLASVEWPARLQRLTRGPLVEALPPGCELWLDGGHNEDCGIALARQAAEWAREPAALPLHLIFGMLTTKDASGFLRPLARHARTARAVPIEGPCRLHAAGRVRARRRGRARLRAGTTTSARRWRTSWPPSPRRCAVLICGSLYVAGQVLARNG